jgi:glycosyltransferase involved in cell wall biosynthesis
MGISVVICCYNSSKRLGETLKHLAQQRVDGFKWELIIVDNASKDDSIAFAQSEWERLGAVCPLKVVSEPRQGTGYARMTGVQAASYEYILFCDDDNWLNDDYLLRSVEIMKRDPEIGVLGGSCEAVFENNGQPDWFDQYKGAFACGKQSDGEGYLDWKHMTLYSAGMTIRKDAVMKILDTGYTFLLTGRRGESMQGAGEDSELVMAIRLLGYKAYYTDKLFFHHYMPQGRMNWAYLKKLLHGAALSSAQLYIYADVTRYIYTGESRYKVSPARDLAKAVYGAFLIKKKNLRDMQIVWAKLTGAVGSVLSNLGNYKKYEQKIKRLYELGHKGAE